MQLLKLPSQCNVGFVLRISCFLMFAGLMYCPASAQENNVRLRLYNAVSESNLYNADSAGHTAWKPLLYTDSLMPDLKGTDRWFNRKFFKEHLVQVQTPGFNFYGDFIVDEYIGKSNRYLKKIAPTSTKYINVQTPGMDTRGFEITGNIGKKVYFETDFYENQGKFGGYIDSFIRRNTIIPGQGSYKNIGDGSGFDFSSSATRLVYLPNKHLLFDLGYGKNFIGDGYRSLLLSENSFNYPYLRVSASTGKFQYSAMWAQYVIINTKLDDHLGDYRKWGQTYFLDWQASKNLTIGLFESVTWPDQTSGSYRGKDVTPWLLSPVMFLHGSKSPSGVQNNDITGINAKFKFYDRSYIYGQAIVNQLGATSSIKNRTGFQVGLRSGDVFEIPGLNVNLEVNTVRPYTYQGNEVSANNIIDVNYTNNNQALAHPIGANFTEYLAVATYSWKKWWFRAEGFITNYGADSGKANYGSDIVFKTLSTQTAPPNVTTGQGVAATIKYADFKIAYILNPATNLRIEAGFTYRHQYSNSFNYDDKIYYIGIRMSFRSLLYDF